MASYGSLSKTAPDHGSRYYELQDDQGQGGICCCYIQGGRTCGCYGAQKDCEACCEASSDCYKRPSLGNCCSVVYYFLSCVLDTALAPIYLAYDALRTVPLVAIFAYICMSIGSHYLRRSTKRIIADVEDDDDVEDSVSNVMHTVIS